MRTFTSLLAFVALSPARAATLKASSLVAKASSAAQQLLRGAEATIHGQEFYTTNTACLPNYCMNPVIPGLMFLGENVLDAHKKQPWACAGIENTKVLFKLGGFCSRIIASYPFSIPKPATGSNITEAGSIQMQSRKALETYVGHMSGMGFDFWDYTKPWETEDACIQQVWKMSCYTHFPRCNEINKGVYLPPCRSSCDNYLNKCRVQCCDEGVQCTFTHAKKMPDGTVKYEHGYPDHEGPSPLCTGSWARRSVSGAATAVFLGLLASIWH